MASQGWVCACNPLLGNWTKENQKFKPYLNKEFKVSLDYTSLPAPKNLTKLNEFKIPVDKSQDEWKMSKYR